ncbi:MAG: fibronectin type III domain-containing protein [Candidatus Aminicenantes bacterium]|nr:fibronectin type III domain-containing protein [Candidatus Aminicenantes bacterium]
MDGNKQRLTAGWKLVSISLLLALLGACGGGTEANDSEAPSVPSGLVASAVNRDSLTLSWTASTDNVAVTGYRVYRNGALLNSVPTALFSDSGLAANTTYSYTVAAFDAADNVSAQSAACSVTTLAQPDGSQLPRAVLDDFIYLGSFRAPFGQYGQGKIAYNPAGNGGQGSLYLVGGGSDSFSVGEISIPTPVNTSSRDGLASLPVAAALQAPADIYSRIPLKAASWPAGSVNRYDNGNYAVFGGLYYDGARLYFNAYTYYDGAGNETATTGIIQNPANLVASAIAGMFKAQGAAHASGWITAIPAAWQPRLAGTHLLGNDNQLTIVSRASAGPSLFACNLADFAAAANGAVVSTKAWLDFTLDHSIWGDDMVNVSGNNKTWTLKTETGIGFIIPGTRTYVLLGTAGGFNRNPANPWQGTPEPAFQPPIAGTIVYKRADSMGYNSGGPAVWDAQDRHYMYAFFDLEELLAAAQPYAPRPYANGVFPAPFARYGNYTVPGQWPDAVAGGAWDPVHGFLYLTLPAAANDSDPLYPGHPVIAVYSFRPH